MSDRVEYINRHLDELEAAAKAAADDAGPDWFSGSDAFAVWSRLDAPTPVAVGPYDDDLGKCGEHIALNDPAAVLARVAADRKLLAEHKAWDFNEDGYEVCGRCMEHRRRGRGWKFMPAPCPTVRLLAEGLGWRDGSDHE